MTKAEKENGQLRYIVEHTLWMARRYAHERCTYAPSTVNECIDIALKMGLNITVDHVIPGMYADDGMFGVWINGRFEKE